MTEITPPSPDLETIDALREFNRVYTRRVGLLEEHLYDTGFTLAEARVLYELSRAERQSAADIAEALGMDPAYLSRILRKMKERALVEASPDPVDARRAVLSLTDEGRSAYAPLLERSRRSVAELIDSIPQAQRAAALSAAETLRGALTPRTEQRPVLLREPRIGEVGWIIHRHAAAYAEEYGFVGDFEGLVAEIAAAFLLRRDPLRERGWIAAPAGSTSASDIQGCAFLTRAGDAEPDTAQLRLLFLEKHARGAGLGAALLDATIEYARSVGYRDYKLWTNAPLTGARKLYESRGFTLEKSEPHSMFGPEMEGQTWRLSLRFGAK